MFHLNINAYYRVITLFFFSTTRHQTLPAHLVGRRETTLCLLKPQLAQNQIMSSFPHVVFHKWHLWWLAEVKILQVAVLCVCIATVNFKICFLFYTKSMIPILTIQWSHTKYKKNHIHASYILILKSTVFPSSRNISLVFFIFLISVTDYRHWQK